MPIPLRTNTATRITVGPFYDKTDGVTPETAITVTSCKLTMTVDTGGVPTLVLDTNPTASGGNNDMVHITGDDAGFYDLELTAANTNYLGRAKIALTDAATHCPVWDNYVILPANVYDAMNLGTAYLSTDAVALSGDTTAADNLETAYDDTPGPVRWVGIVDQGTAQSVTSTTIVLRSAAAFVDDALNGCTVVITNGTQIGERAIITDYVGATDTATVVWTGATPSGTPTYQIYGSAAGASLTDIAGAVWNALTASYATVGTTGKALTTASSAGDPWSTTLPGAYAAGSAGSRIGRLPDAAAGSTGGLFIAGTNAATTITTGLTTTFTGNLTGSVASVTGNLGGNVTGSVGSVTGAVGSVTGAVGSVTGAVGSVTGNVGGNVVGSVGSLGLQAKTDVNSEVNDVLVIDTFTQPFSVPPATTSLRNMISWLYTLGRNKITQTATTTTLRNDADSADIGTSTVSDNGVMGERDKFV